ncbi:MAG: four helix bundle protein [Bacteroides sp.]|nr:four helix bundle protein [Bacteroides sp.]
MRHDNVVYIKAKRFALRIYWLKKELVDKREYVFADQILRSGTSIGANISEAIDAASRPDFHNKLRIALKECSETKYWLELLRDIHLISTDTFQSLYTDVQELYRLLSSICKTLQDERK